MKYKEDRFDFKKATLKITSLIRINILILKKLYFQRTYLEYTNPFKLPMWELSIDEKDKIIDGIVKKG